MFKRRFKIAINWLLALTLTISMATSIKVSAEVSAPKPLIIASNGEAANNSSLLKNSNFEEAVVDNKIPGWRTFPEALSDNTSVEISEEKKYSGKYSIKITDENNKASVGLISEEVSVAAGEKYTVSAKVYVAKASVRMYVKFYDKDKKVLTEPSVLANTLNTWADANLEAQAPEGAVSAEIWFYMGTAGISTAYCDDVIFKQAAVVDQPVNVNFGEAIDLGEAVQVPLSQGAAYARDSEGNNEQYFAINGAPATFYAVNAGTGKKNFSQPLPGLDVVWAMSTASDGNVYFAGTTNGKLYSYLTKEKKIVEYGPVAHKHIWDIKASNDGKVYMASYVKGANGKVFEFDIASKTFKDLGEMKEGAEYVRGLGLSGEYLYAGVGGVKGSIIQYSLKTGEKKEIPVDKSITGQDVPNMFSEVVVEGGKILASTGTKLFIFDEKTFDFINAMPFDGKISTKSPYNADLVYYKAGKTKLFSYNIKTNESKEIENIPPLPSTGFKNMSWITLNSGPKKGQKVLAAMAAYTDSIFYHPEDGWFNMIYPEVPAQGVAMQSLEISPEGQLYIGGYMRGASIYDTITEKYLYNMPTFHQPEGMGFMNGNAYFGTYGGAVIYKYDPRKPFNYREDSLGNPGVAYDMEEDQDRPFVMVNANNKLFIGTFPGYGQLGGALSIYEEDSQGNVKNVSVNRNIVQDQSIVGIAYKDGKIYASSAVDGGLGSTPTATEAKVIIVDEATGKKIKEVTPKIPGISSTPKFIGSLSFGPDGLLWAATGIDGTIFAMNPDTLEVVKSKQLYPGATQNSGFRPYYIRWDKDGLMYTTVGKKLTVVDTKTMNYKTLVKDTVNLMTIGQDGSVYYGAGTKLMKLPVPLAEVKLSLSQENVYLGGEFNLNIDALLFNGLKANLNSAKIEYVISEESIISLENGKFIGKNVGETDIKVRVTLNGNTVESNTIKVNVLIPVKGVKVYKEELNMKIGETEKLIAEVSPEDAEDKTIRWETNNAEVATVDENGVVKALGKGQAVITVITNQGGHKATVLVKVSEDLQDNTDNNNGEGGTKDPEDSHNGENGAPKDDSNKESIDNLPKTGAILDNKIFILVGMLFLGGGVSLIKKKRTI